MRQLSRRVLPALVLMLLVGVFPKRSYAQNVDCIGPALASYVNQVITNVNGLGGVTYVRYLTPAFNMSHPDFPLFYQTFADAMGNTAGRSIANNFYAIAGNAYHHTDHNLPIQYWLNRIPNTYGKPIVLTETGWYPGDATPEIMEAVKGELAEFLRGSTNNAGILFNIFNNNPDFVKHAHPSYIPDRNRGDPAQVSGALTSGGNSGQIGANSGRFFMSSTSELYDDASSASMGYILEIAKNDDRSAVLNGVRAAHDRNLTPVIRLGVGMDGGGFENPATLAEFIVEVDRDVAKAGKKNVLIILGPNEPLTECWATPECGCDSGTPGPRTLVGKVTSSRITTRNIRGSTIDLTNEPVEGLTVCAYSGKNKFGTLGTAITGYITSDTTDEKGLYELHFNYTPGQHFISSTAGIPSSVIVTFYEGMNYVGGTIVPVGMTLADLGAKLSTEYAQFNHFPEEELLLPLPKQVDTETLLASADFRTIPNMRPAIDGNGQMHPECPEEAFYISRDVSDRVVCAKDADPNIGKTFIERITTTIDLTFTDTQYLGRRNIDQDFSTIKDEDDGIKERTLAKKEERPEGRSDTKNVGKSLVASTREGICAIIRCNPVEHAPRNEGEQIQQELRTCQSIVDSKKGYNPHSSLNQQIAFGVGLGLMSPGKYQDPDNPETDPNNICVAYHSNPRAWELPYCITDSNEEILFGEVEPPDSCKEPGVTKTYKLSNIYWEPSYIYFEGPVELTNVVRSQDSYEHPEGLLNDVKLTVEGEHNYKADPDNDGKAWAAQRSVTVPAFTWSTGTGDRASSHYMGTIPLSDGIASPYADMNERVAAQNATMPSINGELANFAYKQVFYNIGVMELMCSHDAIVDPEAEYPITNGVRQVFSDVRAAGNIARGGVFDPYYKYFMVDEDEQDENMLNVYGDDYQIISDSLFHRFFRNVWSLFTVNNTNYNQGTPEEGDNECFDYQWIPVSGCYDPGNSRSDDDCVCDSPTCYADTPGNPVDCNLCANFPGRNMGIIPAYDTCTIDNNCYLRNVVGDGYKCAPEFNIVHKVENDLTVKSPASMVGVAYFTQLLNNPYQDRVLEKNIIATDSYATDTETDNRYQGEGNVGMGEIGTEDTILQLNSIVKSPDPHPEYIF